MRPVPVGHRPPSGRQVQRRIDGDQDGLAFPGIVQNLPVLVEKSGSGAAVLEETNPGRPVRDAGQINAEHSPALFLQARFPQLAIRARMDHDRKASP
jgi:hypothetical protein